MLIISWLTLIFIMIEGKVIFKLASIEYDWVMVEESTLRLRFKLCCIVKLAWFFQTNVFLRVFIYLLLLCYLWWVTMMEIFILINLPIFRRKRNPYCLENFWKVFFKLLVFRGRVSLLLNVMGKLFFFSKRRKICMQNED